VSFSLIDFESFTAESLTVMGFTTA